MNTDPCLAQAVSLMKLCGLHYTCRPQHKHPKLLTRCVPHICRLTWGQNLPKIMKVDWVDFIYIFRRINLVIMKSENITWNKIIAPTDIFTCCGVSGRISCCLGWSSHIIKNQKLKFFSFLITSTITLNNSFNSFCPFPLRFPMSITAFNPRAYIVCHPCGGVYKYPPLRLGIGAPFDHTFLSNLVISS